MPPSDSTLPRGRIRVWRLRAETSDRESVVDNLRDWEACTSTKEPVAKKPSRRFGSNEEDCTRCFTSLSYQAKCLWKVSVQKKEAVDPGGGGKI